MSESPSDIDRIAPTRRPDERPVMYQRWRHLLFLHWSLPVDVVAPLLPKGLTLDTFDGRAWIGLVPFTMRGVRPRGLPAVGFLSDFHETNVRTYVHAGGKDPGVWFFSLEAANAIAVRLARAWFKLPYHYARMSLDLAPAGGSLAYRSERRWPPPTPASCAVRCTPRGPAAASVPGSFQHFLVERYFLYSQAHGELFRGQVHHAPYQVREADVEGLEETLLAASGLPRPAEPPLALFSEGVDVDVFRLRRVAP
ncbi:YqjF family protein [Melittangium boletus]|uniref:YqjF family protein n=1 Tax=Melittangium boletus TaxID=83453 RepID=UPI003DA6C443